MNKIDDRSMRKDAWPRSGKYDLTPSGRTYCPADIVPKSDRRSRHFEGTHGKDPHLFLP